MKTMQEDTPPWPQTALSAAQWFRDNGVCISEWARQHDLDRMTVTDLLRGKLKGNFGQAHEVAVALELKPNSRR